MTNQGNWSVRRASIEDLPLLRQHWKTAGVDGESLEKNLTEFQIAEEVDGNIRGVIGVKLDEKQACIYHESFAADVDADTIREVVWKRINNLAQNHALYKIWTASPSLVWIKLGFKEASRDLLSKKPDAFQRLNGTWKVLILREPAEETISLDKEFELFQQAQVADRQQLIQQAAKLKKVAYTLLVIVLIAGLALLVIMLSKGMFALGRK